VWSAGRIPGAGAGVLADVRVGGGAAGQAFTRQMDELLERIEWHISSGCSTTCGISDDLLRRYDGAWHHVTIRRPGLAVHFLRHDQGI